MEMRFQKQCWDRCVNKLHLESRLHQSEKDCISTCFAKFQGTPPIIFDVISEVNAQLQK